MRDRTHCLSIAKGQSEGSMETGGGKKKIGQRKGGDEGGERMVAG